MLPPDPAAELPVANSIEPVDDCEEVPVEIVTCPVLPAPDDAAVCTSMLPELVDNAPDPDERLILPPIPPLLLFPASNEIEPPTKFPELPPAIETPPLLEVDSTVLPVFSKISPLLPADSPVCKEREPEFPAPETVAEATSTRPLEMAVLVPEFNETLPPVEVTESPPITSILPPNC